MPGKRNYRLKHEIIVIDQVEYPIRSLLDNQQFEDPDAVAEKLGINSATWPLFGVVWPASLVLASRVCKLELTGLRVLEIGCGIALSSIVLHRMKQDITASDYHPLAQEFLDENVRRNGLWPIKYLTGNWETENPLLGKFDLIIGSDVLYQPGHAADVANFIDRHSLDRADIMIVDPGRENRSRFTRNMIALGFSHNFERFDETLADNPRCKGRVLHFQRRRETIPDAATQA